MPTRTDFLNLSPLVYYEFEESTPPFSDTQSNLANTTNTGTVISSAGTINGGALVGGSGNSQLTFGTGLYSQLETAASWSVIVALKDQPDTSFEFAIERDIGDPLLSIFFTPTVVQLIVHLFNEAVTSVYGYNDTTPITGGDWHTFGVSYNSLNGLVSLYDNGVLAASATIDNGGFDFDQYDFGGGVTEETWISANGARIDNFAVYSTALSSGDMMLLTTPPVPADIYTPTTSLYVGYAEEFTPRVALRVTSPEVFTPSLNLDVRDINVSHITGTSADWRLDVKIDGVAANTISQASTEFAEDESPLAYVEIIPDPGVIDPEEWENKTITIDFIGVDGGADIYSERRFTGKTDLVELNINSGMLKIRATGDIQGKLDAMTTADIDSLVGGSFSPHVFSADDIGYDYAQDVIETVPKSFQIMPNGALVVTEWAAKSLPDITFIDSSRFDDTLDLDRASRSDLVNKATVYVDFRFPRLRQRNMSVNWYSPTAWCDYLTIGYTLCSKDAVDSAFNSTGWTVMGPVIYEDVPGSGTFTCGGTPRAWIAGQDLSTYCLGATAKLSRRWVQTVTETAEFTIVAPDSVGRVGELPVSATYNLEATYDEEEFERNLLFDSEPEGATINTAGDYTIDADNSDYDGRAAFDVAQIVAVSRETTRIIDRHRRNTVSFSPVYRPDIDLTKTIRVEATGLVCQGKVRSYKESFDLNSGDLGLSVDIALSRHGGSGTAISTPIEPAEKPPATIESSVPHTIYCGYHIGGRTLSLPESEYFEGYVTNAVVIEDPEKLYQKRFRVVLPEIEESARSATIATSSKYIELNIPQDELIISV